MGEATPRTTFEGPFLEYDFPSFEVGVAEYDEGPTGCTVFHFLHGADTSIDARGGWVGTIGDYQRNLAICLAGGSLPGLEATAGIGAELWDRAGRALDRMPLVSGAICFDYGGRENRVYPDYALGRAAVRAARAGLFPLGARGAGRSATCGKVLDYARGEPSGQGGAFRQVGPTKVAAFTVVNALGVVLDREGGVARGNLDRQTGRREHPYAEMLRRAESGQQTDVAFRGNTTLTVVITNQKLSRLELTQFGRQVHSSMTRVIFPFHTVLDGDVLFAVTTDEVANPSFGVATLGALASEAVWDAILSF